MTSSKYIYGIGYGPFMPGVHRVPFPYCVRCPSAKGDSNSTNPDFVCCGEPLEQLRVLLKQASHPKDTAAILVEPILGEGAFGAEYDGAKHSYWAACCLTGVWSAARLRRCAFLRLLHRADSFCLS